MQVVLRDITRRKQDEQALRLAKNAAEAANRAKDHFLAVLSHELRTPLNPALMAATMLEKSPQLPDALREDVSVIRRNVELEARLIEDLLDLTRIARGKITLCRCVVDGCEVLRHAIDICRPEVTDKRQALELKLPEQPAYVDADPARLQQVFWNLLKNAVKFTPDYGRISVSAAVTPAGALRIQVADTGIGIEPQALTRIFDAFEQGGDNISHRYGGLGLGLAISKGLMQLHGGSIAADSAGPGKGSVFTVELPCAAEPAACAAPAIAVGPAAAVGRILLVEDHQSTAVLTARLLRSFGHTVEVADCVRSAMDKFAQQNFDLVISDLGLPDGTGRQLLGQLLAQKPVKAIALSGYGQDDDLRQSAEAGFLAHLIKPINATQLERAVEQALAGTKSQ